MIVVVSSVVGYLMENGYKWFARRVVVSWTRLVCVIGLLYVLTGVNLHYLNANKSENDVVS